MSKRDLRAMPRRDGVYFIEGEKYPSVTTIMQALSKPALINWAAKQAAAAVLADPYTFDTAEKAAAAAGSRKGEAAERGRAVHSLIEAWARGALATFKLPPELQGYQTGFENFLRAWQPVTQYTECTVVSKVHSYAGRTDWIGSIGGGGTYLLDFKTGKAIWPEMGLQLVAYKNAESIRCNDGDPLAPMPPVDHTGIVLLPGDGTFDMKMLDEPFEAFLALKRVYEWTKQKAAW